MRLSIKLLAIVAISGLAFLTAACDMEPTEEKNRERAVQQRTDVFSRAESVAPIVEPQNFPGRQALVEFTVRQDAIDHPWYVYILGDNGNTLGYYVAKTRPINSCNFLSSSQVIKNGTVVVDAPSLDGIFYGGSGTSAGCDAWFFFDLTTDALIEIRGVKFFTADQPLALNADPIMVAK